MPLGSGTRLGPYEIQSPLGAGGMGEVYRARDTRLDRTVAVKVLAAHLSNSPELKQRMEREARAISSLNHPNVCHLYDIGSHDGTDYLVMEFLEGETLADRIRKGPIPLNEILKIGIAVAEALAVAHRQGIVHRDLKPGNIMLTKGGAKLMDFGLAKSAGVPGAASSAPLLSAARTMSGASPLSPLTTAGALIGTVQYMSPEQIEGKEADARSDLFALGAVLYEMVTGARPFAGKSQISVASAILEKDPERISTIQPLTPPAFEHVIIACLAKNPDDRFQTAQDVALELKWIAQSPAQPPQIAKEDAPPRHVLVPWLVSAAFALLSTALIFLWRASKPAEQTTYYSAPLPFAARDVAVAPNGHTVTLVGHKESQPNNLLWIYEPGSPDATPLANTEGATFPFWSADGHSLGFFAGGKLKRIDLASGQIQTLCDAPTARGGTWNKDGVILFTPSGHLGVGISRISAAGGTPTAITVPDRTAGEDSNRWVSFLPDGIHFLYSATRLTVQNGKPSSIFIGALGSTEKHLVTTSLANAVYAAPGYLLFYRDKTLFAQRFNETTFQLSGEPFSVLTDIQFQPRISKAVFATNNANLLVAQQGGDVSTSQLRWFNRQGQELGTATKPGIYGNIAISPDGKTVAADTTDPLSQNTDIWIYDLASQGARHLTFDPALDSLPIWSPDGNRMFFTSNRGPNFGLYLKDTSGAQEEKRILEEGVDCYPTDWSRDGKYVIYQRDADLWYLTFPDLHATEFLKATATLKNARFSPDGKWLAYSSNESGRWEIYVTSFPDRRGKWQVSTGGGIEPKWRTDGKELFYLSSDFKIMAIPVKTGANFDGGAPVTLFQANPHEMLSTSEMFSFDVSKDGQRFLINTQLKTAMSPASVVLNWTADLKQ